MLFKEIIRIDWDHDTKHKQTGRAKCGDSKCYSRWCM